MRYEQSLIASAAPSKAAVEALASKLEGECPGILSSAPEPEALSNHGELIESARKHGELNREERQRGELDLELLEAISIAMLEADRGPTLIFAHTIASLRWTNASISAYVHAKAAAFEWALHSAHPDVCADMRAWTESGYRMLSPATKTRVRESRAIEHPEREQLEPLSGPSPETVLSSFERAEDRLMVRRLTRLAQMHRASLQWFLSTYKGLLTGLGVRSGREERLGPPKGATVIESGTTAAGGSFTIWITPKPEASPDHGSQCSLSIWIEESETHAHGSSFSSSGESCLSRLHPSGPSLECDGDRWRIEGQTVEGAQNVRLALSNGHEIASPVAIVPAADGGPAGFYYQVLIKSAQTPVSLTELDASGKPLVTIEFSPKSACPKNIPPAPKPPESLPGGGVILRGRVSHGPHFVIIGERTRFEGRIESGFSILVASEERFGSISSESELTAGGRPPRPSPFQLQSETGCQPHEYAILYGLLKAPEDTVSVRAATGLRTLRRAPIPRRMHTHGVLAYVALSAFPTEIVVRTPGGKTVFAEKLTRQAREARETCEGEAEGPAR